MGNKMNFIIEWYKAILALGFAIVGAGGIAWLRSTFVSKKEHKELEKRLTAVETTIQEMPSSKDIHDLEMRLVEVSGKIDGLNPQLTKLNKITDLLMENELRGTRKDT